jgi:predicted phosphoribosyltransferase
LLVLSIPRGGVVVGDIVAQELGCAHDVVIVKKIGYPGHEELAIGAMAEDGESFLNEDMLNWYSLEENEVAAVVAFARDRIEHHVEKFRRGQRLDLAGKTVIITDDGIATGETMKAAIRWMRPKPEKPGAAQVIVAVPVCSKYTADELELLADELVCLYIPDEFMAVSQFYWRFEQVSDDEVLAILPQAHHLVSPRPPSFGSDRPKTDSAG